MTRTTISIKQRYQENPALGNLPDILNGNIEKFAFRDLPNTQTEEIYAKIFVRKQCNNLCKIVHYKQFKTEMISKNEHPPAGYAKIFYRKLKICSYDLGQDYELIFMSNIRFFFTKF